MPQLGIAALDTPNDSLPAMKMAAPRNGAVVKGTRPLVATAAYQFGVARVEFEITGSGGTSLVIEPARTAPGVFALGPVLAHEGRAERHVCRPKHRLQLGWRPQHQPGNHCQSGELIRAAMGSSPSSATTSRQSQLAAALLHRRRAGPPGASPENRGSSGCRRARQRTTVSRLTRASRRERPRARPPRRLGSTT